MTNDPLQLALFPNQAYLRRFVPEANRWHFYAMRTLPTLFGDWTLQREWGRLGAGGQLRHDLFRDDGEALNALTKLAQTEMRRGYRPAN